MKKFFLFALLTASFAMFSCSDDDDNNSVSSTVPTDETYSGILSSGMGETEVACTVAYDENGKNAKLIISGLKFTENMPSVDVSVSSLSYTDNEGTILLAQAGAIVPEITLQGQPFPADSFLVSEFTGFVENSFLRFTVSIGSMGEFAFNGSAAVDVPGDSSGNVPSDSAALPDDDIHQTVTAASFEGRMNVIALNSTTFTCNNSCKIEIDMPAKSCNLYILDAKFAENMPLTIDILLKDIPFVVEDGVVLFEAENVVPLIYTDIFGQYIEGEEYKFSYIRGVLGSESIAFDADMTRGSFGFISE